MSPSRQSHRSALERTVFPSIYIRITEVIDGFTATVWLRTESGYSGLTLLTDESVKSIDEARAIANRLAQGHNISLNDIDEDITLHTLKPHKQARH